MALDQNALNSLKIDREPLRYQPSGNASAWRKWLIIGVVACVAVGAWWQQRSRPIEVSATQVLAARADDVNAVLDASGYVVARRQATISSKVTGKVEQVLIEEGQRVKAGEVLATLDPTTTQRQLDLAQLQLLAAQAEQKQVQVKLAEAQRAARRAEQLRADKMLSEADLDTAQSTVASYQAQLESLQSQIKVAEASLQVQQQAFNDLTIRAPFAGVVISKDAQPGEMVSPLSAGSGYTRTGIATLVDMDSREIEVDVNEAFINRVMDGQKTIAVLDAYPDWRINSHVVSIVPTADRQKATVKVRIGFDALDARILPDMGVKVQFLDNQTEQPATNQAPRLQVSSTAIVTAEGKSYVWRIADNAVQRVEVTTGSERSGNTEVLSGVQAGDSVVLTPGELTEQLKDGRKVSIKP